MRFTTTVAVTAAALLSLSAAAAQAVEADPEYPRGNPPATNCLPSVYNPPTGQKDKPAGHYYDDAPDRNVAWWFFAQSGTGTLTFSPEALAEIERLNGKVEAICPVGGLKGGKGVWTPVGADGYSNINLLNGRIWYPGGWKITNPKTGRSHRVDGFWLHDFPFLTKASANAYVDDKRVPHEIEMAHYNTVDVFANLLSPRLNQGTFTLGPTNWKFLLSEQYAKELNEILGAKLKPGTHVLTLEINASVLPGQNMPLKPGLQKDEPGTR
ncbi:hypothetical protein H9Y04_20285 [Streptomyces sp. TRM66268-LWL]|uniref:Uncharacterized protein n=1 Tax=Streptomyces polyasparticus TaxID=2767826 RepID=A0ABR7SHC0_9ACTN|nr:hypothetical protein [Streptomyces polyasparticus]MBC9714890.1 hypothetical protein [Streptomyces polyasparticus]